MTNPDAAHTVRSLAAAANTIARIRSIDGGSVLGTRSLVTVVCDTETRVEFFLDAILLGADLVVMLGRRSPTSGSKAGHQRDKRNKGLQLHSEGANTVEGEGERNLRKNCF